MSENGNGNGNSKENSFPCTSFTFSIRIPENTRLSSIQKKVYSNSWFVFLAHNDFYATGYLGGHGEGTTIEEACENAIKDYFQRKKLFDDKQALKVNSPLKILDLF